MSFLLVISLMAAEADPLFVRGDVDGDFRLAFQDAIRLLDYEFADGPTPPCIDAADFDDDGAITLGDPVGLLLYLFAGGSAPPPPNPSCGADPTPDALSCEVTQVCRGGAIVVRGRAFVGDAYFFCLDRSSSMLWDWQEQPKIRWAKEWTAEAIQALDERMEFGLLAFSGDVLIFSEQPVRATEEMKETAIAWIGAMSTGEGGTCLAPAGVRAVEIASCSTTALPRVFIITDGIETCDGSNTQFQCLRDITAANARKISIDTVFVPDDSGWQDPDFLRQLAAANGGDSFQIAP